MTPITCVYISLGSNMGDNRGHLETALRRLGDIPGVRLDATSSVYMTEPQGDPCQPWFANQVARFLCDGEISAFDLLRHTQAIEEEMGRQREPARRFGPRVIDIDILLFGSQEIAEPDLVVPHPRMHERAFVLVPLSEIDSDAELPGRGTLKNILETLPHTVKGHAIRQPSTSTENH